MGHVRDLPRKTLGVDVKKGFAAEYEVLATRKKVLDELKAAAKDADTVYLAADPDREGEAICWHLAEELKTRGKKQKVRRVVFNEITKRAIEEAFKNPTDVDEKKVDAQQARRILDRLVGYKVSPILWDKVRRGLSAGRVQSVALRLICDREREIKAFIPEEYWSVARAPRGSNPPIFPASLAKKDGKNVEIVNADQAAAVRADLEKAAYVVQKVQPKERRRNPVAALHHLQAAAGGLQEAPLRGQEDDAGGAAPVRRHRARARRAASASSPTCAPTPRASRTTRWSRCATASRTTYGADYLPEKPNFYRSKKDAQDAHEAIRPTYFDRDPESIKQYLSKDELALYKLIWNRFVASQMKPAVYDEIAVEIAAGPVPAPREGLRAEVQGLPRRLRGDAGREGGDRSPRGRTPRRGRRRRRVRRRCCRRWPKATA